MKIKTHQDIKTASTFIKLDKSDLNSMDDSVTVEIETTDNGKVLIDIFFLNSGDIGDFLPEIHKETPLIEKIIDFLESNFMLDDMEKIADEVIQEPKRYNVNTYGHFNFIEIEKDFKTMEVKKHIVLFDNKIIGTLNSNVFSLKDNNVLLETLKHLKINSLPKSIFGNILNLDFKDKDTGFTFSYENETTVEVLESEKKILSVDYSNLNDFINALYDNGIKTDVLEDVSCYTDLH